MKTFFLKYSWLPGLVLLASCWKEPNFPNEPHIDFSYINQSTIRDNLDNPVAEITIAIKYQDGNGDLGLDDDELNPPYDPSPGNKFTHNYFVETFIENQGKFEPYVTAIADPYNGRFLRLDPDARSQALEGELRRKIEIAEGFDIQEGARLKFRIQIADRSLNLSNTIETDPITMHFPR
jgi:hypothetical protein